jgi:diguanylate cyclase (GGDEF)-like protein
LAVFALGGLSLLCYFFGWWGVSLKLIYLCAMISVLYPLIGVWQYRKGRHDARFYVVGWTVWSLAVIVGVLRHAGIFTDDFVTFFSPPTGLAIEAILLSFALADRINRLRDENTTLELTHIEHLRHEQETLERVVRERTLELEQAMQRAELLAMTDVLTELLNRRAFFEYGEKEYGRATRYHNTLSLIMFDLDGFKEINDQYGHAAGDAVLVAVAQATSHMIRKADTAGRIGGEEFAILLPNTDLQTAVDLAERLRRSFEELTILVGRSFIKITASFGVVAIDIGNETLDESLNRADMALYRAKESGRNRVDQAEAKAPGVDMIQDD